MSKRRQAIILSVFGVCVALILIEVMLQVVDPFGQVYQDDLERMYALAIPNERGFSFPDGVVMFSHWQASMNDSRRVVPDSNPDGVTVYFIGDSVTFGYGVNDGETWVNLLAKRFDLNAVNLAIPGLNRENIYFSAVGFIPDGACVVYLAIPNDDLLPTFWRERPARGSSRVIHLLSNLISPPVDNTPFSDYWRGLVDKLRTRYRLLTYQINNTATADYAFVDIPDDHRISFSDKHFNAQGNRLFVEKIASEFGAWLETCK